MPVMLKSSEVQQNFGRVMDQALSEDEVVEKAMAEYLTSEVGDVEDIPAFLKMVVRVARQGMTVNPF